MRYVLKAKFRINKEADDMSLQNSHFSYTVNKTCLREKIMDMAKCPLDKEISRTRREPGLFIWTMKE